MFVVYFYGNLSFRREVQQRGGLFDELVPVSYDITSTSRSYIKIYYFTPGRNLLKKGHNFQAHRLVSELFGQVMKFGRFIPELV